MSHEDDVYEKFGRLELTKEEWENFTTHDALWLFNVCTEMTRRTMHDFLHDHKDPDKVDREMSAFLERLSMNTGLSNEDIFYVSKVGAVVHEHEAFRDDPEGARNAKFEQQNPRELDEDEQGEVRELAKKFADMIDRRNKRDEEERQAIQNMEFELAKDNIREKMQELSNILGFNPLSDEADTQQAETPDFNKFLDEVFGRNGDNQ